MTHQTDIEIGGDALGAVEAASIACGRLGATVDSSPAAASYALLVRHTYRALGLESDALPPLLLGEPEANPTAVPSGRGTRASAVLGAALAAGAICAPAPSSREAQRAAALDSAVLLTQGGALAAPWVAPWELDAAARAAAVQVDRSGAWTEWVRTWCGLLAREAQAAESALRRATRRMAHERSGIAGQHRIGATDVAVVDWLHSHPKFTIRDSAVPLGLTLPTVGTSIERLQASGVATELTGQLRNRVWIASAWLELITAH